MTASKLDFLVDRAAVLGQKLAIKLEAGKIPGKDELSFFDGCMDQLIKAAPAHELSRLAGSLREAVTTAKAKRALWLTGREQALKRAALAKAAKVTARLPQRRVRANKQGLPFVVQLPLAWQDAAAVA